jgi:hypothetical protein
MTEKRIRPAFASVSLVAIVVLMACGETTGAVLERVPEQAQADGGASLPPDPPLRLDVIVVRELESCAYGEPCRDDPDTRGFDDCFEIERDDGTSIGFDWVDFVPPDDEHCSEDTYAQAFNLVIADDELADVRRAFEVDLQTRVYRLSGEKIWLDVRVHDVPVLSTGGVHIDSEWGIFLSSDALASTIGHLSRETDFTFAVTGSRDPERQVGPRLDNCAGSILDLRDGPAGAPYTWLTTECLDQDLILRHWLFQAQLALREANPAFANEYTYGYPFCGEADELPSDWFPGPSDCSVDPDAPTCGDNRCDGTGDEYVGHVLTAHWPGRSFVGNHCSNGRQDFDEFDVDVGGVCDKLGR